MTGAAAGLVLLAPLLAALAVAVRLDSPGPVLFLQTRLGRGGRPFRMVKFRTMHADAEAMLQADPELYRRFLEGSYKLPPGQDPRISRLGWVLRRSSLDELPQLVNVLLGHMSLVGPRPIVPDELRLYGEGAGTLLSVRPGITGHWQVSGRSRVGYPERAALDLDYVRRWSLARDLAILCRTVPEVLRARGAF